MTVVSEQFSRGPLTPEGEHMFDQERLERDFGLTQRIQAAFTPNEPTEEKPHPRIIDGRLDDDGQAALSELWDVYRPAVQGLAYSKAEFIQKVPAVNHSDLISEGFIGLFHSSLRWHPDKNITFLTHVSRMANTYMDNYISDTRTAVRLPKNVRAAVHKLNRELWKLYAAREHQPSKTELAKELGIDERTLERTLGTEALTHQMGSIDGGYFEDDRDKHTIGDFRPGEHSWKPIDPGITEQRAVEEEMMINDLARMVKQTFADREGLAPVGSAESWLNDREKAIIQMRFLTDQPMTLTETGRALGIDSQIVRSTEATLLAKLRRVFVSVENLRDYWND